jgi:hypothetical protein
MLPMQGWASLYPVENPEAPHFSAATVRPTQCSNRSIDSIANKDRIHAILFLQGPAWS